MMATTTTTKRGRGRPKSTVPSSTKNQNSPEPQSEIDTGKREGEAGVERDIRIVKEGDKKLGYFPSLCSLFSRRSYFLSVPQI